MLLGCKTATNLFIYFFTSAMRCGINKSKLHHSAASEIVYDSILSDVATGRVCGCRGDFDQSWFSGLQKKCSQILLGPHSNRKSHEIKTTDTARCCFVFLFFFKHPKNNVWYHPGGHNHMYNCRPVRQQRHIRLKHKMGYPRN